MLPGSDLRTARWWWLLLASFVICLVTLAPAALLEWGMSSTPNAKVRVEVDAGTVWKGRGRAIVTADAAPLAIPFGWRFDPLSLLGLRLAAFVDAGAPALSGTAHVGVGVGAREFQLRGAAIDADARVLSALHPAAALFAPAGRVKLRQSADEHLRVRPASSAADAWHVDGALSVNAEQLAFGGIINAPVGNHAMKLRGDGSIINFSILRPDGPPTGPLKLEGTGTLTLATPRRFTFSGFATAAANAPDSLKQLGPTMADGRQRIEVNALW